MENVNEVIRGIADELVMHLQDLAETGNGTVVVDDQYKALDHYDFADTPEGMPDSKFVVYLKSGRQVMVTLEEMTELAVPGYNT